MFDVNETEKHLQGYVNTHVACVLPEGAERLRIRTVISKGKPAKEISALADREAVDLVVMGSAKGNITNKVIRLTRRPVMAVSVNQRSAGVDKMERILVATDFSEHSRKVVEYAFELKRLFNAKLYMVYVIGTNRTIEFAVRQGHYTGAVEKMREWATNQMVNLTPDEFIDDPTIVRIVENGSVEDKIADVAFQIGADLTILGTHEYGATRKRLLGTTTDKLLNKTPTPVLTVKL
jgi:nucleotide-binding universal stress UspA family protein